MAGSVSAEVWLNQRRWDALEESLKAQGSNIERHLQDYLIKLYNETVPFDQWLQIENAITKEELESAQAAEDQKVYAAFHIREHGHDSIFSTGNGEEFLDVAIRLRHYVRGGASAVRGDFSHHFYKTQSITRERFDELAALRLENTGKVTGAFEIDLDAGWCSALNLADGWQTFKIKDVSTAAYENATNHHVREFLHELVFGNLADEKVLSLQSSVGYSTLTKYVTVITGFYGWLDDIRQTAMLWKKKSVQANHSFLYGQIYSREYKYLLTDMLPNLSVAVITPNGTMVKQKNCFAEISRL